jgi:hypothetical protein
MKIGFVISELRKLNGSDFNPRELSGFAALAFTNSSKV